jgi:uncharacterized membrane protein
MIEKLRQHQLTQHVNDTHSLDEAQNSAIQRKFMQTLFTLQNTQKILMNKLIHNTYGDCWLSFSCAV